MTYIGTVSKGKVRLPRGVKLPEGTKVRVEAVEKQDVHDELVKLFEKIAAEMPPLPADLAKQHDHYLYGTPKR